jgi:predicted nucleic-acid-binding Zn-ribbon protein
MRLPWQPREYERTCGNCGYAWRVPRSVVKTRPISGFTGPANRSRYSRVGTADPRVAGSEAIDEVDEAYRCCPRCGSDRYTQQPAPAT